MILTLILIQQYIRNIFVFFFLFLSKILIFNFRLVQQAFVSKVDNYYYDDTNYPGVFINYINPLNTSDVNQTNGNPVLNVVQTDYTSYALVWFVYI